MKYLLPLLMAVMVLGGCKERPLIRTGSMRAPRIEPGQVVKPIYQLTTGYTHRGGGGAIVEWKNTPGIFLGSISDFGRFYPHRYDLRGYDVAAMVQSVTLTSSATTTATVPHLASLESTIAQWRKKDAGYSYDGIRDLIAGKISNEKDVKPIPLARRNPAANSIAFAVVFGVDDVQYLTRAHVIRYDSFGGYAEVSYTADPGFGTGWPLLNEAGELIGILGKIYGVPAGESNLPENRNSALRDIMVGHFIGVEQIRAYLEKIGG